jgi:solute:Na+ symporter, SSS family
VFLPFYRRLDVTSAYEYLERRFSLAVRWLGSGLFILFQCGRMAVVLYLPALALAAVSDLNIETCIVGIGLLCIVYTVVGGIEAVIWTDVVQALVLIAGAVISIVYLSYQLDGGWSNTFRIASEGGRLFESVNWSWDLTVASAWVIMIGALFHNLLPYAASQDVVQRYLTTTDEATAARGIWLNALLSVPAQAAFFLIGTGLYVFYRQQPERMDVTLQNDAVFPFFVVSELPMGLAGLIVAGIFSASQSTLSSSMNSIATAFVTDFYRRLLPRTTDAQCLSTARGVTITVGVIGILIALLLARTDIRSAYETFIQILGLFGGVLSGLFVLGIFTRSATGAGAIAGALISAAVLFAIRWQQPLQVFAYAPIGLLTCVTSGWLLSLILPSKRRDLSGLTYFDLPR